MKKWITYVIDNFAPFTLGFLFAVWLIWVIHVTADFVDNQRRINRELIEKQQTNKNQYK